MELLFANCMNVIPEAAASRGQRRERGKFPIKETIGYQIQKTIMTKLHSHSPTMPNKMQYMAPNIGNGIVANNVPNFAEKNVR